MCIASISIGAIVSGIAISVANAIADTAITAVSSVATALGIGGAAGAGAWVGGGGLAAASYMATTGAATVGTTAATGTGAAAAAGSAATALGIGTVAESAWVGGGGLAAASYMATTGAATAGTTAAGSVPWGTIGSIGLTALGAGASVAGSVLGTVANMQNNQMQSDMAAYLAAREEANGILALRQGERIDLQANQDRLQLHNKMLQSQGDARASFAARGVALGSGTPNDYEADIADAYDLDSRNLEYDVAMKKWKYKVEAYNHFTQADIYRGQSEAYRSARSASLLSGLFGTAGSAMSGLASGLTVSSKLGWI